MSCVLYLSDSAVYNAGSIKGSNASFRARASGQCNSSGKILLSTAAVCGNPKWQAGAEVAGKYAEAFTGFRATLSRLRQFYCLNVESFRRQRAVWMENVVPFVQEERMVQDIDTLEDWEIAEIKYRIIMET